MGAHCYCYICGGPMDNRTIITDIPLLKKIIPKLTPSGVREVFNAEYGEDIIDFLEKKGMEEIITKQEKEQLSKSLVDVSEDSKYQWLLQCILLDRENNLIDVTTEDSWEREFNDNFGNTYYAEFYLSRNSNDNELIEDDDGGFVMHKNCYKIATMKYGHFRLKDFSFETLDHGLAEKYQTQEVHFHNYFLEDNDWILENPISNMKNKRRIFELLHHIHKMDQIPKGKALSSLKSDSKILKKDDNNDANKLAEQILRKTISLSKCLNKYDINFEEVAKLINKGANANARNVFNRTALHFAATEGRLEYVKFLLENGADVNARDGEGLSPLHLAITGDQLEIGFYLIKNGADIHAADGQNRTALHKASLGGFLDFVRFLLEKGVEVNKKDMYGRSALHDAALCGHMDVAVYLLKLGAPLEEKDIHGRTPLHYAATLPSSDFFQFLLKNGGDPHLKDNEAMNAFEYGQWFK